jgi:hypothetical protein
MTPGISMFHRVETDRDWPCFLCTANSGVQVHESDKNDRLELHINYTHTDIADIIVGK